MQNQIYTNYIGIICIALEKLEEKLRENWWKNKNMSPKFPEIEKNRRYGIKSRYINIEGGKPINGFPPSMFI